ncbi:hypothetical protein ACFLXG_02190 [Chloroflexota bacterium]
MRDFARATGILAKTDNIDAWLLALFALRSRPEIRPLPDQKAREMRNLLTRHLFINPLARAAQGLPIPPKDTLTHCLRYKVTNLSYRQATSVLRGGCLFSWQSF